MSNVHLEMGQARLVRTVKLHAYNYTLSYSNFINRIYITIEGTLNFAPCNLTTINYEMIRNRNMPST